MKKESLLGAVIVAGVVCTSAMLSSCGWDRVGDDATWNDTYNAKYEWVNFTGVYQQTSGWYVVTQFRRPSTGTSSGGGGGGGGSSVSGTRIVTIATADGLQSAFGTTLTSTPIMPGTFSVAASLVPGVQNFYDAARDGVLVDAITGTNGGFVNYFSGSLFIEFSTPPTNGSPVVATYITGTSATMTNLVVVSTDHPRPGSTQPIFQFTVFQDAYQITLRDNYGNVYSGRINSISSTAGGVDTDIRPGEAVTVVANFEVYGDDVAISGTLEGTYTAAARDTTVNTTTGQSSADTATYRGTLENRIIRGVWMESNGTTGEIEGMAADPTPTN